MPFPTYKKKADIPAGAEDVYEEKDGEFVPKLPDVSTLESTLAKVRAEKKDADKAVKDATTKAEATQRELEALKTQVGDPETRTRDLLKKFDEDLAKARAEKQAELDKVTSELRTLRLDDKAKEAFVKAGGRPERADAALRLVRDRLDLSDDRIVVKDEKGEVTTTSVNDFFGKDFIKTMPELFKGTQAGGGGAAGVNNNGGAASSLTAEQIAENPGLAFAAANTTG